MKVKKIRIENYLGIDEIDVIINKDKIFIEGGNGIGKTSVLEAIENAMNSTSDRRPKKVMIGEEKAMLLVELDDGTEIKRTIEQDGTNKIDVKKDGLKVKAPETFLKQLFGGFSFNPVDFLQKKDKEQAEILLNMIPFYITRDLALEWFKEIPEINYEKHGLKVLQELAEEYFFNKRAVANKEVKELNDQIDAITAQLPPNYSYKIWEDVSLSDKYQEIEAKRTANSKIDKCQEFIDNNESVENSIKNKYSTMILNEKENERNELHEIESVLDKKISEKKSEKAFHESEIKRLEEHIASHKAHIHKLENEMEVFTETYKENEIKAIRVKYEEKISGIKALEKKELLEQRTVLEKSINYVASKEKVNLDSLLIEVKDAETMKGFVMLDKNREKAKTDVLVKNKVAEHYNALVEFCRSKPRDIIAQMKLPIENLGIDKEGNITIKNIPIKNLSTAEQLDLAIDIARVTAGELKIICIDRFESMDSEIQQRFMEKTENDGFTYCITRVTEGELKIR